MEKRKIKEIAENRKKRKNKNININIDIKLRKIRRKGKI